MRIYEYHHDRILRFYHGEDYEAEPREHLLYLGAEVETDNPDSNEDRDDDDDYGESQPWNDSSLENRLGDFLDLFEPQRDGSLHDGCEFVSHPLTLNAWLHFKPRIERGFKTLVDTGLRAHEVTTCGLHIHVSRSYLSEEALSNVLIICENNIRELCMFARRKPGGFCHRVVTLDTQTPEDKRILVRGELYKKVRTNHYSMINYENVSTVEFRIFKGTLNPETFYATLHFVNNLCNLANKITPLQALSIRFEDVVEVNPAPELVAYVERRKILSRSNKEYSPGYADDFDE